jgi:NADPH-dependent glutamate synthase beta subunit-like oxidoreductase
VPLIGKRRCSVFLESEVPVCVVGAGPAGNLLKSPLTPGFYTALALLQSNKKVRVDIVEALPTPFGLVRSGVAPDHQEVCDCLHF